MYIFHSKPWSRLWRYMRPFSIVTELSFSTLKSFFNVFHFEVVFNSFLTLVKAEVKRSLNLFCVIWTLVVDFISLCFSSCVVFHIMFVTLADSNSIFQTLFYILLMPLVQKVSFKIVFFQDRLGHFVFGIV